MSSADEAPDSEHDWDEAASRSETILAALHHQASAVAWVCFSEVRHPILPTSKFLRLRTSCHENQVLYL
jgi:hypothetical protein